MKRILKFFSAIMILLMTFVMVTDNGPSMFIYAGSSTGSSAGATDQGNAGEPEKDETICDEDSESDAEIPDMDDDTGDYVPAPTRTLEIMSNTDYFAISTSGLSKKHLSLQKINKRLTDYGTLITEGMPVEEYREAMEYEWSLVTCEGSYTPIKFDVASKMTYASYVGLLNELSKVDGVNVYQIGYSYEGRDLYCIELDFPSENEKETIILTGNVHTREFAGGPYIMKQLISLVNDGLAGGKAAELLKNYRIAAIPVCSLDAREGMINDQKAWTNTTVKNYSPSNLWKALANGTDLNRRFPSVAFSLLGRNEIKSKFVADKPQFMGYAGAYAGESPETKAILKFFCHYILVDQAKYYIDYHQQGRIVYFGKKWLGTNLQNNCRTLFEKVYKVIGYSEACDNKNEGKFVGGGSTMTDMALSYACGAKFSPAYGFFVMCDDEKEKTILELGSLKGTSYPEANPGIGIITLEIGYGTKYLGYTSDARAYIAREYEKYHFDRLLYKLCGY